MSVGIPRIDDAHAALARAAPQGTRGIDAFDAQRDRGDIEPLDQREVDRFGPADDGDDLVVVEQRQRRAQPVGGAVGLEQTRRFVRAHRRVGRGEDPRTPTTAVRTRVVREHAPARDHETRGLGCEAGERVGRFDREPILVDPRRVTARALGGRHLTPHAVGIGSERARLQPTTAGQAFGIRRCGAYRREQVVEAGSAAACAARRATSPGDA